MPHYAEVLATILETVTEVQVVSGRSADGVDASTALNGGVEGFDSLNALEVLVMVGAKLSNELPDRMLAPKQDGAPLTLSDLAGRIVAHIGGTHGNA